MSNINFQNGSEIIGLTCEEMQIRGKRSEEIVIMNEFEKRLNQMEKADIDEAQERDFYMWNNYLIEFPQRLYDLLASHDSNHELNELTPEEIRKRKAILDCAYLYIEQAMSDVSQFIQKKYAEEVTKEHLKLNI